MPGETASLRFKATYPGAFIYHCAVPNLDMHISAGMFGMILVEPEEGLPEVDHEFYFGQQDVYTKKADEDGHMAFDYTAMTQELPSYVLLNGGVGAITGDRYGAVEVKTGETARVFFVNGGPNKTSSFHPIGSVWDECWSQGTITDEPRHYVQTEPVMPGSCTVATMHFSVPGDFKLVDHALSRVAHKGCLAVIHADGPDNPSVFDPEPA
jgi:nitrite reductase (NO-forming)